MAGIVGTLGGGRRVRNIPVIAGAGHPLLGQSSVAVALVDPGLRCSFACCRLVGRAVAERLASLPFHALVQRRRTMAQRNSNAKTATTQPVKKVVSWSCLNSVWKDMCTDRFRSASEELKFRTWPFLCPWRCRRENTLRSSCRAEFLCRWKPLCPLQGTCRTT